MDARSGLKLTPATLAVPIPAGSAIPFPLSDGEPNTPLPRDASVTLLQQIEGGEVYLASPLAELQPGSARLPSSASGA